jgi:hypothetical protein
VQKFEDVYRVSLKDARSALRKKLNANIKCYESLQNKDSGYARAIKGMQDLHKAALEIYDQAPDEI